MTFGTNLTTNQTQAGYESLAPDLNAIVIFNAMDVIAHDRDNVFHSTGMIYTLSGETLFHKYDSMYHVLDNAYHRAVTTDQKLKRAKRLEQFFKIQNEIFASTQYVNPAQDAKFEQLDKTFLQTLQEISTGTTATQ